MRCQSFNISIITLLLVYLFSSCRNSVDENFIIKVKISDSLYNGNVSGKLIFLFDSDTSAQLKYGPNHFKPQPVFTYDIENWNINDTIYIEHFDNNWFQEFSELHGEYTHIVFFDKDTMQRSSTIAKGNGYSDQKKSTFRKIKNDTLSFEVNHTFTGWVFSETENIKEIKLRSSLLSQFWGYDMYIESAVVLPSEYDKNKKKYPVVFIFPGFGSSHASITYGTGQIDRYGINIIGQDKIFFFMKAEFFQGYHHFTDSENNGPWASAFTKEFIPYIEKIYGLTKEPPERYLIGQSSGAWTALWLQVNYPELFTAAFAGSPDPIDFRAHAFNIYESNSNFYYPKNRDSLAIETGNKNKLFVELEHLLGEFGQVRTWEATFSPKNEDGTIALLFDRRSGNINPDIANYWSNFDISREIFEDPQMYKESLSGKLHIFVSNDDPYGLAKSVKYFDEILIENQIEADIQYFDGLGHNVWTDELRFYIHEAIDNQ